MLNNLMSWGLGALGLGGVGFAALAWFFGLSTVMAFVTQVVRIAATVFEIVSPLFKATVELVIEYVKWLWEGFTDIIDNYKTIITVMTLCLAVYIYAAPRRYTLNKCIADNAALTKQIKALTPIKKRR